MITANKWKWMSPEDNQLQRNWEIMAAATLFFNEYQLNFDKKLEEGRAVTKFYLGGKEGVTRDNKRALNDMFTDVFFAYPNTEAVKLQAQAPAPVYNYLMSYRGSRSLSAFFTLGDPEAAKVIHQIFSNSIIIYSL